MVLPEAPAPVAPPVVIEDDDDDDAFDDGD